MRAHEILVTLDRNSLLVLFEAIRGAVGGLYLEDDHLKLLRAFWPDWDTDDGRDLNEPSFGEMSDAELIAAYPRVMAAYCKIEWDADWRKP